MVDPTVMGFLGLGLLLGEVALRASKSPLLSPEGTYVLDTWGETEPVEEAQRFISKKTENP